MLFEPSSLWMPIQQAAFLIGVDATAVADWAEHGLIVAKQRSPPTDVYTYNWYISTGDAHLFADAHERYKENRRLRTQRKDRKAWEPELWRMGVKHMAEELQLSSINEAYTLVRAKAFSPRKYKKTGEWFVDGQWVAVVALQHKGFAGKRTAKQVLKWLKDEGV